MERLAKQREREKVYREKRKAKKLAENGGEIVKAKVCPHCQKEFVPTSNRQIFCSKDCCYQARQDQKKADREAEKGNHYYRQRVCAVCGSTYWPTHSQQKFCSEECQKQNHNEKSLEFYHKKQKEKSKCKDLLQTKEPVSSTNSSEIITIPA
jgi:predicted nucleic acid-binding Zn ribbon protein